MVRLGKHNIATKYANKWANMLKAASTPPNTCVADLLKLPTAVFDPITPCVRSECFAILDALRVVGKVHARYSDPSNTSIVEAQIVEGGSSSSSVVGDGLMATPMVMAEVVTLE